MLRSLIFSAATVSLMAAPALAAPAANPASSLSVAGAQRAATPATGKSRLAAPGATVGLIFAALIVAGGIYIAVDGDDDPDSN